MTYQTAAELEAGMAGVIDAPKDEGVVRLVVRRPGKGQREVLEAGQFDTEGGLIGDDWVNRPGHGFRRAEPLRAGHGHERAARRAHQRRPRSGVLGAVRRPALRRPRHLRGQHAGGHSHRHRRARCWRSRRSRIRAASSSANGGATRPFRLVNTRDGRALRLRGANTVRHPVGRGAPRVISPASSRGKPPGSDQGHREACGT